MSNEEKKIFFIVDKKLSDEVFEYLINQKCKDTIHLVTALQNLQGFGDDGFIFTKDLLISLLNYLLDKTARETINFINALQRSKQFVPPAPNLPDTTITDEEERYANEGRSVSDTPDAIIEKFEPETKVKPKKTRKKSIKKED